MSEVEIDKALDVLRAALTQRKTQVTTAQNEVQQLVRKMAKLEDAAKRAPKAPAISLAPLCTMLQQLVLTPEQAHQLADEVKRLDPLCSVSILRASGVEHVEEHHTFTATKKLGKKPSLF